ncbi:MAG: hypothetical protein KA104_00290, partial [Candidatus Pacebacteria bacterium]|nr:hypothetical protein [Candidatus Paceibacterota bacterium]
FTESVATSTTATSSSQASQDVSSSTPTLQQTSLEVEASSTPSIPLPTGVLLDNSFSDIPWSIQVYDGTGYPGHYTYYFTGVAKVANPPVLSPETAWISTGTTTTVRVKRISGSTCSDWVYGGTAGLTVLGPDFTSYEAEARWTRASGDFCDFQLYGEGIPPGTPLSGMVLGTTAETILTGSHASPGVSLNGLNEDPQPGGFAFQLCGISGCAGGFGSSTPTATTTASTTPPGPQVSNVLFLPGIKGSRLYDVDGNKLWEPSTDEDVQKLFLNTSGTSLASGIHTKSGDVIGLIFGFMEVYGSFIHEINTLRDEGKIKEWRIASYDWRLSLDDITNKGVVRDDNIFYDEETDLPYLKQNLLELASSSPTGKVTIIAHSNGGLIAKKLMLKLGDAETTNLIDKVVFVGVPQSGAPQALGALLYGYKEALPWFFPFMVSRATARTFAENAPMAYHLLPSQRYFDDVLDKDYPVVEFNAEQTYGAERNSYGNVINSWSELRSYSLAEEGGRTKPNPLNYGSASVLNENLLTYAKNIHDQIDNWIPPANVTLYQIGGWGQDTISGIEFYELCVLSICKKEYRPTFIEDGDGVVPIPSSLMTSTTTENVKRYWLDLNPYQFGPLGEKNHGNILGIKELQDFLTTIFDGAPQIQNNIYTVQPNQTAPNKKLRFILHSPLTLNLYDASGNHAGPTTTGDSENTIPGSFYGQFGEVQYIIAPAGPEYRLEMVGYAPGTFSLDIQETVGGSVTASTTLANIPTDTGTLANITIGSTLATVTNLVVDSDGNGSTDFMLPVLQDSTSFYRLPVDLTVVQTNLSGSSKSIQNSFIQTVPTVTTEPLSSVPDTTFNAQRQTPKVVQAVAVLQKDFVATTHSTSTTADLPMINSQLLASPLSVFIEIKDILISLLTRVYDFIIQVTGFLSSR